MQVVDMDPDVDEFDEDIEIPKDLDSRQATKGPRELPRTRWARTTWVQASSDHLWSLESAKMILFGLSEPKRVP